MTSWVVDASVVSATLVPGQLQPGADRIVLSRTATLFAPEILRQEFTNAAWRLERRGVMSGEAVDIALARFEALEIEYVDSSEWPRRALTVARRFRQSRIYDAIYLACAEDLDAELWTCDRRFVTSFANHRPARLKLPGRRRLRPLRNLSADHPPRCGTLEGVCPGLGLLTGFSAIRTRRN